MRSHRERFTSQSVMTLRHRVIMAALLAAAILPVHAETPFYFVQITDTHFGSRGHDQIAVQMVEAINSLPMPIACVIHTGDVIADRLDNPGVLAVATGTLARLKAPLHLTPGNHDILKKRVESTLSVYTNSIGPLAERVDYHDVTFLLVHTEPLDAAAPIDGFDPMAWLEKALSGTGDRPVIVCHHRPPVDDFHGGVMHPGWPEATRERWIRLLNRGNVIAVLAGHFHRDELHWLGDVPLLVSAPMAVYWGRQPSFRLYEYRDGRLGYRTIYLEGKGE